MKISRLRVTNLRCFADAEFSPVPGINWLIGSNGAGKTTLLEAAHILSHGRSFRAGGKTAPCRHGTKGYVVHAELSATGGGQHKLGLAREGDRWQARLDGADLATLGPLFEVCPAVYFGPESSSLLLGAADERRSFLDWSVFHVEHASLQTWQRWRRALRQRNTLLRTGAPDADFEPWEHDLGRLGEAIHRMRAECLASLEPYVVEEAARLAPELEVVGFHYRTGWDESVGLSVELARDRAHDRERGFSQRGVHRADWSLRMERVGRREYLSRGQAKAAALVCVLAQSRWLRERTGESPLLCLDDVQSELDAGHAAKLLAWLASEPVQVWLAATAMPGDARSVALDARVFHVEHHGATAV